MVVNVKGRNIHIDDELAKKHETLYKEPVDAELIKTYLFSEFGKDWEAKLCGLSEEVIQSIIQACFIFEE